MIFHLGDWTLDVDIPLTMEISAKQAQEHCDCGYCRNFYAAVDATCPQLRSFLAQFGIDVEAPDELCPFEPTIYEASYILQGRILQQGRTPLFIDGVPVVIKTALQADMETEHPDPYFVICIGLLELSWVLNEPMDEVISPANDPAYMQRMEQKLLARLSSDDIFS